jgi:hypothetical protein
MELRVVRQNRSNGSLSGGKLIVGRLPSRWVKYATVAAARNTCVAVMEIRRVRICKLKNNDAHRAAVAWGSSLHQDPIIPRKLVTRASQEKKLSALSGQLSQRSC